MLRAAAFLFAASLATGCDAAPRSAALRAEFQRQNPCPANGERRGPCPGYVVDHVQPLCAGGADHPSNLQWQAVAEAKVKDRDEVRLCRATSELLPPTGRARTR